MNYTWANNVLVTLAADFDSGATSLTVYEGVAPNNTPPSPGVGNFSVLTLADSMSAPTKIENITYTDLTDNENGTFTLTGCVRGLEGTSDQDWYSGNLAFQAPRAQWIERMQTAPPWIIGPSSVTITYDENNRVGTVTETFSTGNRVTTLAYDGNGRLYTATIVESGITRVETYTYDGGGALTSVSVGES